MAITSGIKFFERSMCLASDGTTVVASSGDPSADRALDRNPITYWRTSGSMDSITETYEVTFSETKTFSRIFLIDHNFKGYTIEYDVSGAWIDFTNVVGIDGSMADITESAYARDTSYYEFDEVSSDKIRISITTTQVANAEKYLAQLIVTEELGTLAGFPEIKEVSLDRNMRIQKVLSGRVVTMKSDEVFATQINFKDYPPSYSADIDLAFTLHDREDNFLVWLCGGRIGSPYFRYQLRGHRLRDVINVQLVKELSPSYRQSVYNNPINFELLLQEDVD